MTASPRSLSLVINYAAYFAKSTAGNQSIEVGQYEAAHVLGFSKLHTLPTRLSSSHQTHPPSLGNEVITLIKDTALAQTIGVAELFRSLRTPRRGSFDDADLHRRVFYFVMNAIVSRSFDHIEKSSITIIRLNME